MFNLLINKMLLTSVSKLKIAATSFILCAAFFGFGAVTGNAQQKPVKYGDVVNLKNAFEGKFISYLDTRGRVMDKNTVKRSTDKNPVAAFKGVAENLFVSTHKTPNRDNGSGSWKIVSAGKKNPGEPLVSGDKIYLSNMYPYGGYLDVYNQSLPIFTSFVAETHADFPVFTSTTPNRVPNSSTWTVAKTNGGDIKEGDVITLQSNLVPTMYLETSGNVWDTRGPFEEYKQDSMYMVWVSTKDKLHDQSGNWQIMLKK